MNSLLRSSALLGAGLVVGTLISSSIAVFALHSFDPKYRDALGLALVLDLVITGAIAILCGSVLGLAWILGRSYLTSAFGIESPLSILQLLLLGSGIAISCRAVLLIIERL